MKQRCQQAKRLRAVIGPRPWRRPRVRSLKPSRWRHLDPLGFRNPVRRAEFVGDTERIAYEHPEQTAADRVTPGNAKDPMFLFHLLRGLAFLRSEERRLGRECVRTCRSRG